MVETDLRKILVWCYLHHCFEDPAEMEQAYATMFRELLQPDILIEVGEHVVLRLFDRDKMKFFEGRWYRVQVSDVTE